MTRGGSGAAHRRPEPPTRAPALLLAPALRSGRGAPLLGTWELVDVSWGELTVQEAWSGPSAPGEAGASCTFTASLTAELVLDEQDGDELEGELEVVYRERTTGCEGPNVSEREVIRVDADLEGGDDIELDTRELGRFDCEIDGDELECVDDVGDEWWFERVG